MQVPASGALAFVAGSWSNEQCSTVYKLAHPEPVAKSSKTRTLRNPFGPETDHNRPEKLVAPDGPESGFMPFPALLVDDSQIAKLSSVFADNLARRRGRIYNRSPHYEARKSDEPTNRLPTPAGSAAAGTSLNKPTHAGPELHRGLQPRRRARRRSAAAAAFASSLLAGAGARP